MVDAMTETTLDPLALLAERAAAEPDTLAHALARHRERFGLTPGEQRRHLRVTLQAWPLLQLCRVPADAEDLQAVCTRFAADREWLERALRGEPGE
jgi:hypothetical protein